MAQVLARKPEDMEPLASDDERKIDNKHKCNLAPARIAVLDCAKRKLCKHSLSPYLSPDSPYLQELPRKHCLYYMALARLAFEQYKPNKCTLVLTNPSAPSRLHNCKR
jgi:hypothetical protein